LIPANQILPDWIGNLLYHIAAIFLAGLADTQYIFLITLEIILVFQVGPEKI
jgi:hypothetical protein